MSSAFIAACSSATLCAAIIGLIGSRPYSASTASTITLSQKQYFRGDRQLTVLALSIQLGGVFESGRREESLALSQYLQRQHYNRQVTQKVSILTTSVEMHAFPRNESSHLPTSYSPSRRFVASIAPSIPCQKLMSSNREHFDESCLPPRSVSKLDTCTCWCYLVKLASFCTSASQRRTPCCSVSKIELSSTI